MWFEPAGQREMTQVVSIGAIVGLATPLLHWVIVQFVINPVFCRTSGTTAACATNSLIVYYIVAALIAAGAIGVMARLRIYRPVLIAVAGLLALWGLPKYILPTIGDIAVEYYLFSVLFYAIAYTLAYWLLRIREFAISVVVLLAAVLIVRIALVV